ncbi:MAG: membrane integrity-associated transporter subunit PqiC [Rhodospirillales bacterium]|nr:membrane integrity-associated transporter subunit PqiC [Rhodospirillales bacterium]MDE2574791.1 membrane integrity-associated transporter subunit PqiC [Rhodospirillales bacterium]
MKRRLVLAAPLALAGCGLSSRPYAEKRQWPLVVARPAALPPRPHGRVLELRTLRAGPGLESRGLQTVQADGSIRTAFYEEWIAAPAELVEDQLRRWLAASGLFAAVVSPGSRALPDWAMEGELTALWAATPPLPARAAIGLTVVGARGAAPVVLQQRFVATRAQTAPGSQAAVAAQEAALAEVFTAIEAALRAVV